MKMYLAGPTRLQSLMRQWRAHLNDLDYEVTARWLDRDLGKPSAELRPMYPLWAREDIADVIAAGAVICCTQDPSLGQGGRHVEFGLGLAFGKRLVVVGPQGPIFHYLDDVAVFAEWAAFITAIEHGRWTLPAAATT